MQLINSRTDVVTNVENRVEFGISKDSAKLFSMLSTSLYSNKEQAVLFEIGANCIDAHTLNGKELVPWDLTMPTALDAHIKFRDFGPGLSEKQVYLLLTTYGESTKSNSNAYIGAYGIGSKSPAAVSSTWNVVSRFQGELKEYFVVIDARGIPSLTKIRTEVCPVEDTGLEVIIPVNPNRIYNWTECLRGVFKHYAVKPNVKNFKVNWIDRKNDFIQSGSCWNLTSCSSYDKIKFIITQREYSVDTALLKTEFKASDIDLGIVVNMPFEIHFQTGEIETSLSREQIQYTKHSLDAIKMRMRIVLSEFKEIINKALAPAQDGLHYRQLVMSSLKTVFGTHDRSRIFPFIQGNKYGVANNHDLEWFQVKVPNMEVLAGSRLCNGKSTTGFNKNSTCWKSYAIQQYVEYGKTDGVVQFKINHLDRIKIVLDDIRGTPARVRNATPHGSYALICSDKLMFPQELQRFIIKGSSLPKPPKVERERRIKNTLWSIYRKSFMRLNPDSIKTGTNKFIGVRFSDARTVDSINKTQKAMLSIIQGHRSDITVVAVKDDAEFPKGVVEVEDFFLAEFQRLNNVNFVETHMYAVLQSAIDNETYYSNSVIKHMFDLKYRTKTPNSVWNEACDTLVMIKTKAAGKKSSNVVTEYQYLTEMSKYLNIPMLTSTGVAFSLDNIKEKVYNTYNMLRYIDRSTVKEHLTEYLELVGK